MAGVTDIPEVGLEDGYLRLSKSQPLQMLLINRKDIEDVFWPNFNQILGLVRGQIEVLQDLKVLISGNSYLLTFKVLFLVGGLGSNLYLSKFLQIELGSAIQVKQPETGFLHSRMQLIRRYSAIMRGAVLHKMGMDYVKERIMRVHYGYSITKPFIEGYHPPERKYVGTAGDTRCDGIMRWFANKVRPNSTVLMFRGKRLQLEL